MKITIKQNKKENQKVPFDEIPVGYVYIADHVAGPIALKLMDNEAILLTTYWVDDVYMPTYDWFTIADQFKGKPAYKILGKLTEIVVEEV